MTLLSRGEGVYVIDHPLVDDRLARLRHSGTDNASFTSLVGELSSLVAYEALADLTTQETTIPTPVTPHATVRRVTEAVLLVPVLRAGLGMAPAIAAMVPSCEVAHVGLRRDESTLLPTLYLDVLPKQIGDRRVVVCDPMLATGGTLAAVCELAQAKGASNILVLCLIASAVGLEGFRMAQPMATVVCAAIDPTLDERGYIVPGLGDAGDRLFGPPP